MSDKYVVTKSLIDDVNDSISAKSNNVTSRTLPEMKDAVDSLDVKDPVGGEYPNKKTEWRMETYPHGMSLGSSVTVEQSSSITDGTFDDMYIGDYWEVDGIKYIIAAFDRHWGEGPGQVLQHHITLIPDQSLYYEQMYQSTEDPGASYEHSYMNSQGLSDADHTISNAHLGIFFDLHIPKMAEIYGDGTSTDMRLTLFKDNSIYVPDSAEGLYWTQDVSESTDVARFECVLPDIAYTSIPATEFMGVRPIFNTLGNMV